MQFIKGTIYKVGGLAQLGVGLLLAIPLLALRPLVIVEVQEIRAERLGHLAMEPELFLSLRSAGTGGHRKLTLFFFRGHPANTYLAARWRQILPTAPRFLLAPIYNVTTWLPNLSFRPPDWDYEHVDLRPLDNSPPNLTFTPNEISRGQDLLTRLGLERDQPYVCLCVRDASYLAETNPTRDWSYHDYRDSHIGDYVQMAEVLVSRGYAVIRMGKIVTEPFTVDNNRVVDYASSPLRNDFGDIYLFANCSFCISTSTGMDALAFLFRRPVGMVNLAGFDGLRLGRTTRLATFKSMTDSRSLRQLPLEDSQRLNAMTARRTIDFARYAVTLNDNTEEELAEFAGQMDDMVRNRWTPRPDQLQRERSFLQAIPWHYDMTKSTLHLAHSWFPDSRNYSS